MKFVHVVPVYSQGFTDLSLARIPRNVTDDGATGHGVGDKIRWAHVAGDDAIAPDLDIRRHNGALADQRQPGREVGHAVGCIVRAKAYLRTLTQFDRFVHDATV